MEIERRLGAINRLVDSYLDRILPSGKREPAILHKAMRYAIFSGGKRIRPSIVVESSNVCRGRSRSAVIAAAAIELVHTYSLIHDDLPSMDDDDMRRGRPSCHKVFGEANAILAGDALLTLAFNTLARNLKGVAAVRTIAELSEAIGPAGMVAGQVMDIKFSRRFSSDIKGLDTINRLKTARLFEVSSRIGAIVAGAASRKEEALAGYGLYLGMAFQTVDDIIDSEGIAKLLGEKEACLRAAKFVKKAEDKLSIFGARAGILKKIAVQVLERIDGKTD